eukprot:3030103-Prymnesium_polylepis.2
MQRGCLRQRIEKEALDLVAFDKCCSIKGNRKAVNLAELKTSRHLRDHANELRAVAGNRSHSGDHVAKLTTRSGGVLKQRTKTNPIDAQPASCPRTPSRVGVGEVGR